MEAGLLCSSPLFAAARFSYEQNPLLNKREWKYLEVDTGDGGQEIYSRTSIKYLRTFRKTLNCSWVLRIASASKISFVVRRGSLNFKRSIACFHAGLGGASG
jgi:hypothetical protein